MSESGTKFFYFVRHGESEANVAQVHGGAHHPLSEKGRKQAEYIAERCVKLNLEALYASGMVRARQTGEIIALRTGLPLQSAAGMQEVGMPSAFMERLYTTQEAAEEESRLIESMAPGYRHSDEENFDDILARAERGLAWLAERPESRVGIVSHGLFIRCLIARAVFGPEVSARELLALWRGFKSENTGLTVLEFRPHAEQTPWRVITWNDHAHLG